MFVLVGSTLFHGFWTCGELDVTQLDRMVYLPRPLDACAEIWNVADTFFSDEPI